MITVQESDDLPGGDAKIDVDDLLAGGWVYRSVPWMTPSAWETLVEGIGDGQVVVLAMSVSKPSMHRRGQMLISPAGMKHLRDSIPKN